MFHMKLVRLEYSICEALKMDRPRANANANSMDDLYLRRFMLWAEETAESLFVRLDRTLKKQPKLLDTFLKRYWSGTGAEDSGDDQDEVRNYGTGAEQLAGRVVGMIRSG
jgi:hypothetical protein